MKSQNKLKQLLLLFFFGFNLFYFRVQADQPLFKTGFLIEDEKGLKGACEEYYSALRKGDYENASKYLPIAKNKIFYECGMKRYLNDAGKMTVKYKVPISVFGKVGFLLFIESENFSQTGHGKSGEAPVMDRPKTTMYYYNDVWYLEDDQWRVVPLSSVDIEGKINQKRLEMDTRKPLTAGELNELKQKAKEEKEKKDKAIDDAVQKYLEKRKRDAAE